MKKKKQLKEKKRATLPGRNERLKKFAIVKIAK